MKKLIALDDGHGITTSGKESPIILSLNRKIKENEFNRAVIKFLDEDLKRCGFNTLLVAPTDEDTPLQVRTDLANNKKADAYISIHYNALDGKFDGKGRDPEGQSIHIYPNSANSMRLAKCIHNYLVKGTVQKDRGIIESNFHVLRETNMASILSENGFMDNEYEASLMLNEKFQREVAEEHCKGICDYFGVKFIERVSSVEPTYYSLLRKASDDPDYWIKIFDEIIAQGNIENSKKRFIGTLLEKVSKL